MSGHNLYQLLKVRPDATAAEIRTAFRQLARELHPDHTQGDKSKAERFAEIHAAYKTLSDERGRAQYDHERSEWARQIGAVLCGACGQANRVREANRAVCCGHCGADLDVPVSDPGILAQLAQRAGSRLRDEIAGFAEESVGKLSDRLARLTTDGIEQSAQALRSKLGERKRRRVP